MAKLDIAGGSTAVSLQVFIQDSTSTAGAGLTGLAYNSASLTAYYAFPTTAGVAITLASQTATGAFASGGFCSVDGTNMPGFYRLDILNAMLASTNRSVAVMLKGAANMAQLPLEISITGVNNQLNTFGLASTLPVNVTSWAGVTTATTNVALATLVNVTQWAGFAAATTQVAVATMAPANAIQWAGFTTATTQQALATFVNVNQWAGFNTATTQLAIATTAPLATTGVAAIWAYAVDGAVTAEQSLRLANSANGAKLSGASGTDITIQDLADTKARVTASGDIYGNRLTVTRDLT